MKTILAIVFCLCCTGIFAQQPAWYFFEPPYHIYHGQFQLDSSNSTGSWQIGKPQKTVFNSAYTYPNAIVTDTLNPYHVNDTSTFVIKVDNYFNNGIGRWYMFAGIQFHYKLDVDSGEIVKVEIATDSGKHWVDLLQEDTAYGVTWTAGKPDFTQSTNGWKVFSAYFEDWANNSHYNDTSKYLHLFNTDSTYVRFTFISDSVQTNKDGWIIDNLLINQYSESISTVPNNNLISLYPNPATDFIYIKYNYNYSAQPDVAIYSISGQQVYAQKMVNKAGYIYVDLPDGIYQLVYQTDLEHAVKQLVIHH